MKIGILTFHKPINYGAFLQAFALSSKLKSEFPDATIEIIDYIAPKEQLKILINVLWGIKHFGIFNCFKDIQRIKAFRKSLSFLPLSKNRFISSNLNSLYSFIDSHYDLLIIGSDAVFNWNQNGFPSAFIPNYRFKKCKVITYAVSIHGLRYKEQPDEYIKICSECFSNMKFISVRDKNTEIFVNTCNSKMKAIHSCDPTLFINLKETVNAAGQYHKRIEKKYNISLEEEYIVLMMPDNILTKEITRRFKDKYLFLSLNNPSKYTDCYLYDLTPFEWAMVLSKAKLVVTSFFHGALLSFIQNTPTIVIDFSKYNTDCYEGKLKDLLYTRLELPELYFDFSYAESWPSIDYIFKVMEQAVNRAFNQRIKEGILKEAITSKRFFEMIRCIK